MQGRIIYRAWFQVKIPKGSLIILTAIFEIGLTPLLNLKMAKTQFWDIGREEVTSNTQNVPTFTCKVTGARVRVHAHEPSHVCETLTPVTLHAKVGSCWVYDVTSSRNCVSAIFWIE